MRSVRRPGARIAREPARLDPDVPRPGAKLPALAAAVIACMVASGACATGAYKWVDDDGKVHYGDRPPASTDSQPMRLSPGDGQLATPDDDVLRAERRGQVLRAFEAERHEREARRREQRETRAKERERARECAFAREDVTRLHQARYIYDYDHAGQRRILSDEERADYLKRFEAQVNRHCK